jgi:hypothetical protein
LRKKLAKRLGERARYVGTANRFGSKRAFRGPDLLTLCLEKIATTDGTVVADHLWLTVGKQLDRLNPDR